MARSALPSSDDCLVAFPLRGGIVGIYHKAMQVQKVQFLMVDGLGV